MNLAMPVLETERLRVRGFELDDLDVCHQLLDHEAWQTGESRDGRRRWLEWSVLNYRALAVLAQPPYGDRAVVLRTTGEIVGAVGLVPIIGPLARLPSYGGQTEAEDCQPEFGLFWATRTAHQNQGYATEAARALIAYAFGELRLRRIVATTDYDNVRSQAVMRRLGMRLERNPRPEPVWFQIVGVLDRAG